MSNIITARDLDMVTTEIKFFKTQTQRAVLEGAIEIGRRLVEAKAMVGHGNWGAYLEKEVEFSQSTANNMMRIYEEYGTGQASLFGGNSQTILNLDYTKALALLALPAEDREEFAAANDVEHKSVREINEIIRQRDEAIRAQREAEAAQDDAERAQHNAERRAEDLGQTIIDQADKLEALQEQVEQKQQAVDKLKAELEAAKKDAASRKKEIAALKKNPVIPEDTMAQLRTEAEAAVAEKESQKAQKEFREKLEQAEKDLAKAVKERDEAISQGQTEREKAEAVRKQLQLANPDAAVFKELFKQVQEDFNRLTDALLKVQGADPELAKKFRAALRALLDQQMAAAEE